MTCSIATIWKICLPVALLVGACSPAGNVEPSLNGQPSLRERYANAFLVGVALDERTPRGEVPADTALALQHFNSVTPENVMKWHRIQPEPGHFEWGPADEIVAFARENDLHLVGHTLVWHNQTPDWVFEDEAGGPVSREVLIERMRQHILAVAGRYRGQIDGWDVVNEALNEDGSMRDTPWYRIIGEDYLELAFRFAHEADPDAELYYNDYNLHHAPKRAGAIRLIRDLQARGVPIHGVGTQEHIRVGWPEIPEIESAVVEFAELGLPVMITELDVDVLPSPFAQFDAEVTRSAALQEDQNPYTDGLPPEVQEAQARRYAAIFEVYWRHRDKITRVTFWGLSDRHSWLNNWPVRGRTNYPLLFDRDGNPKPAFDAVMEAARQ